MGVVMGMVAEPGDAVAVEVEVVNESMRQARSRPKSLELNAGPRPEAESSECVVVEKLFAIRELERLWLCKQLKETECYTIKPST